jgi:hypothetical protein
MSDFMAGVAGSVGSVAVFAFLSFAIWMDYRKKKDERDADHRQRMKALELGFPPQDAEIERARAYGRAAWAAGLIGLLVPLVVVSLTVAGTIVAVLRHEPGESIGGPLMVAWLIASALMATAIVGSLMVIANLPRPTGDVPQRVSPPGKRDDSSSAEFQEKRLEL